MNRAKQFAELGKFKSFLSDEKKKTLKWQTVCWSGTANNCSATISYYASTNPNACGDIVLFPGLATNTNIDPLMKNLMFWGLNHRRNVITIDTFLGEFKDTLSPQEAKQETDKNTYSEFVSLIEQSIKFIQPYTIPNKNILIGHSAGATGLTDALNNLTAKGTKTNAGSVILFAPCFGVQQIDTIDKAVKRRIESNRGKYPDDILVVPNAQDVWEVKRIRYVYISPKFITDMFSGTFRPDLMNKWGTYITIVAAQNDTKVSIKCLKQCFEEIKQKSNSDLFKMITLSDSQHSILAPNQNNRNVLNIIKNQKVK
jgi:hypothetical protein